MGIKRGIIQSRGLGDIIIALPIARYYYEQGDEIVWPICEEFVSSVQPYVDWVEWVSIPTDPAGKFFLETPLQVFKERAVDENQALFLYQYLNIVPELTDPEFFNILKFDQYKYQVAAVPFVHKWKLSECIVRNAAREAALAARLNLSERYCVAHLAGSSARVDAALVTKFVDPAVQIINIDDYIQSGDSIFDWLGVLEGAETVVCLDSVFANMIDQLQLQGPELYWIRRSSWDLTPVLGSTWTFVPTNLPIKEPQRVDPAAEAAKKRGQPALTQPAPQAAATPPKGSGSSGLTSHVPFETDRSKIPTSFMHALRK
ncbi:MAG: hypothetical protein ACKOPD_08980 [Polynucleobacter victoriensis]